MTALVAVLDYGIGNLRSAQKALERVGVDARLTADPGLVRDASAVVLPGVGNFGRCMEALADAGLRDLALDAAHSGRPFLGICVGMQMLFDGSDESPGTAGLGVVPGTVRWLPAGVKRPQMQWNVVEPTRSGTLFDGGDRPWLYFLHSFHAVPDDPAATVATCDYGGPVVAAVEQGAVAAVQFHPEKSAADGLRLLRRWAATVAVPA